VTYAAGITEALHNCRALVLVFSSSANLSRHVINEVERAVHQNVPIVPFRIEDVAPSAALEYFIGSVHWLDALTQPMEAHLDRLGDTLEKLLKGTDVRAPFTPPRPAPTQARRRRMDFRFAAAAGLVVAVLSAVAYYALATSRRTP